MTYSELQLNIEMESQIHSDDAGILSDSKIIININGIEYDIKSVTFTGSEIIIFTE